VDIKLLTDRLDELITFVRFEGEGGGVLVPERPVELDPLVGPLYPGYDPEEWDPPYFMFVADYETSTAVSFEWTSDAPISWSASIGYFESNGRAYVVLPPDDDVEQAWQAIAIVDPADHRPSWNALVAELVASNGTAYGIEILGSLPTGFTNRAADRIDEGVLRRGLESWAPTFLADLE
jgi:hypothetical protein